jgi:excisionase family DNA binding protein
MLGEAKPLLPKPQAMTKATEAKFSIKEVAQRFRVHATTVYRLMDKGKLGFYQIGGRRIVGEGHIEQYLSFAERKAKVIARPK